MGLVDWIRKKLPRKEKKGLTLDPGAGETGAGDVIVRSRAPGLPSYYSRREWQRLKSRRRISNASKRANR